MLTYSKKGWLSRMKLLRHAVLLSGLLLLVACSQNKFISYDGPEVTQIVVFKEKRVMLLLSGAKVIDRFDIDLGFGATGDKHFEGDGRTPEGRYRIDRRNPNSSFYLSLGISYPNAQDIAFARAHGRSPGGDIFIHGKPNINPFKARGPDWTAGCIAVSNRDMRRLYAMIKNGTVIDIHP